MTPTTLLYGLSALLALMYLPAIVDPKHYRKELKHFFGDRNIARLIGVLELVIAFLFLSVHWKLSGEWLMVISIIGWGMAFEGMVLLWEPRYVYSKIKRWFNSDGQTTGVGVLVLLLSIGLAYVGYALV